jgi:hypothetical protein
MNKDISITKKVDFFGEVEQFFLKYMYVFQTHNLVQKCSNDCINNGNMILSENSGRIGHAKLKHKNVAIVSSYFANCSLCKSRVTCDIRFKYNTLFVFMEPQSHFKIHEIPNQFMIDGKKYLVWCSILHLKRKKHFVAVFNLGGQNFVVDNLNPSVSIRIDSKNH